MSKNQQRRPIRVTPRTIIWTKDAALSLEIRIGTLVLLVIASFVGRTMAIERLENLKSIEAASTANALMTAQWIHTLTAMPTKTPLPPTLPPPTSTNTPTPIPTRTSTPLPTTCSTIAEINIRDTTKGNYLRIHCSNDYEYELGPLANGVYAIGPNRKFLIYCSNSGELFGSNANKQSLRFIENIKNKLPIIRKDDDPWLELTFLTGENQYWVRIRERKSGQSVEIRIPLLISQ